MLTHVEFHICFGFKLITHNDAHFWKLEQCTWLSLAKILGERGEILVKSLFENVRKAQGVVRQPGSTNHL